MESKRKTRQVPKDRSATQGHPKSEEPRPKSTDVLIRQNGELVEQLYQSKVWIEIISPLISEGVASVSGRLTNGRYHHGDLTRTKDNEKFLAGYQKALMDLNNWINDFVIAKDKLKERKKQEASEKTAPLYNPFLEDRDET